MKMNALLCIMLSCIFAQMSVNAMESDEWNLAQEEEYSARIQLNPMNVAIRQGDIQKVEQLLKEGADVNLKAIISRDTPLFEAVVAGNNEMVKLLLTHGADANQLNYDKLPLVVAAWKGDRAIVSVLLAYGARINTQDGDGYTALHAAAYAGHEQMVKFLLEGGADYTLKNKEGKTALDLVDTTKNYRIASLIIDKERVDKALRK